MNNIMEIQERLYSVCMTEDELALFSDFEERIYGKFDRTVAKLNGVDLKTVRASNHLYKSPSGRVGDIGGIFATDKLFKDGRKAVVFHHTGGVNSRINIKEINKNLPEYLDKATNKEIMKSSKGKSDGGYYYWTKK